MTTSYAVVTILMNGNPYPIDQGHPYPYEYYYYCSHDHTSYEDSIECLKSAMLSTWDHHPAGGFTMCVRDPTHMPIGTVIQSISSVGIDCEIVSDEVSRAIVDRFFKESYPSVVEELNRKRQADATAKRQSRLTRLYTWKQEHPLRWKIAMRKGAWKPSWRCNVQSQRYSTFLLPSDIRDIVTGFGDFTDKEMQSGEVGA